MKIYRTQEIVRLHGGRIGLSKEQAALRMHCLVEMKEEEGIFEIRSPVEFKAGECIALEAPDKITLAMLESMESEDEALSPEIGMPDEDPPSPEIGMTNEDPLPEYDDDGSIPGDENDGLFQLPDEAFSKDDGETMS